MIPIIFNTYNRAETAVPALQALALRLHGDTRLIIADDGSGSAYQDLLLRQWPGPAEVVDAQRRGVGAAKNMALDRARAYGEVVLMLEDDWVLTRDLSLDSYAQALTGDVGMIRLGWMAKDITCRLIEHAQGLYWDICRGSGCYGYSGQVSLRHRRFYDDLGMHALGLSPGEEELDMCRRWNCNGKTRILYPAELDLRLNGEHALFRNIGLGCSLNGIVPEN